MKSVVWKPGAFAVMAALALALGTAAPVRAQAVYGSIAGTVLDATGAALPGVNVTITSVERRTTDTVVTNESGNYAKARLIPGTYEVKAELTGFKVAVVSNARVGVDAQTKVDFRMELGQMTEAVTVSAAEGQLLKTDRADVATVFDDREVTELPILDRNFTKLILYTPGTQQLMWQHAASENPQGSNQTMVNGQHFSGTGYQLDGTDNRDPILGIIVINPNLEAIGETKITSQNYDAEFGQATAGVVSIQTKSGTNEFHGSLFEFYQTDKFQARNPFSQPDTPNAITGRVLPETSRHQFGAALGGPIAQNKWFFFADYQGLQSKVGGSRRLTVPTEAARRGDLSGYGVNIYDPLTGAQFPGNVIPASRLSPQAQNILQLIPTPNAPGIRDNFIAQGSETFDSNAGDVRLDGRLNERLNVFARYSIADYIRDGPTAFGTGGGQELVTLGGISDVRNHSVAAGFDYTLSSTSILDVRFGFFKYGVEVLPFDYQTTPAADAGIPGLNFDDFSSGLPAMFLTGGGLPDINFGSGLGVNRCNCPLSQHEKQFQAVANFSKILGNHTVKMGVDVRRAWNLRVPSDAHRSGELSFSHNRTSLQGAGGLGLATFLIGDVTQLRRYVSPNTDARERQWRHFYYLQDTWRATPKLTLNYGLRLDMINPQTVNEAGNGGWLDLTTGEIQVGGVGGINLAGNVKNSLNWAPRVGITYQLNERTVIRAGYGRSYDIGVFGSTFGHSVTQNLPVLAVQELNAPQFERVFTLAQGAPPPVFPAVPSDGTFPLPNGVFTRAMAQESATQGTPGEQKQRLPSLDAYNLTVQRQLTSNLSFEIAYVGNKGTHVFAGDGPAFNVNEPTLQGFLEGVPQQNRRPFFAGPIQVMNGGTLGGSYGWTQGIDYFCNCADNRYDSLQTKLTRRFANGYSFQANYTFQRVRTHSGGQFFYVRELEYGRPDWDRKHNFSLTALAELPFGRGRRFLTDASDAVNAIFGGWQVNTAVIIQSGLPFNVSYAGAGADRDTGPNRPDLISGADPMEGGGSRERWFNTNPIGSASSAFSRPARGTFGNLERNAIDGPGYWRVDASLFKRFMFGGDRYGLELRVEAVNVFNHVNLGNPDTEIGTATEARPNAGRITSTAYFGADPQRNLQFAARFTF
jgi:outer membrane receptor protein involved in Fe transport